MRRRAAGRIRYTLVIRPSPFVVPGDAMKQTAPCLFAALLALAVTDVSAADAIPPIARVLPPAGLEIPADIRARLEKRLADTKQRVEQASKALFPSRPDQAPDRADIEVFTKAVEYALLHREFYVPKDFEKADWALDEANRRLDVWTRERMAQIARAPREQEFRPLAWPWATSTGLTVRGYRSRRIDDSPQPYGLVIPENHDFEKPCPLYVWLHGRGDKNTDLHFLHERATKRGQIAPEGAIVLHPFGRHCVGYKSAGEVDVQEAVAQVRRAYRIDPDRIVLIGFSMGGAGAWLVGSHSASEWVAVSPGAGFAETAQYTRLQREDYPHSYEQKLWGLNDVPGYVRNLFNTQTIAYSGELDKQIQAARIMEGAFQAEGRTLTHLIGPGVEHKYEPSTLAELLKRLEAIVAKGRDKSPQEAHLQTKTLRYPRQSWLSVAGLEEHWRDARIDAVRGDDQIDVQTTNVTRFGLELPAGVANSKFVIDGQKLEPGTVGQGLRAPVPERTNTITQFGRVVQQVVQPAFPANAQFAKRNGRWQWFDQRAADDLATTMHKRVGVQGPIDDAFTHRFLIVAPTGKSKNPRFQAWVDFELAHFCDRWRALMRGEPPVVKDVDFTEAPGTSLVLFGDPDSNSVLGQMILGLPVEFKAGRWKFGDQVYDGDRFVPSMIYPQRVRGQSYRNVVLNSGLTFREGHDRTNSLQNPKLPDWAIIDITQPPDAFAPGRIHDADFFDEQWQLKRTPLAP